MEDSTELAERVRLSLPECESAREVKMFGGVAFMMADRMVVSVSSDSLLARIAPERDAELVLRPGARRAEMGKGRSMGTGWIAVDRNELESEEELRFWLDACLEFHARGSGETPPKRATQ